MSDINKNPSSPPGGGPSAPTIVDTSGGSGGNGGSSGSGKPGPRQFGCLSPVALTTLVLIVLTSATAWYLFRDRWRLDDEIDVSRFGDLIICGNGTLDAGEECDLSACWQGTGGVVCSGDIVCDPGQLCNASCQCAPALEVACGNGLLEPHFDEECDSSVCWEGTGGVVCSGEVVCDPGDLCSPTSCQCEPDIAVSCGNGLLEPQYGELCDPTACSEGTTGVYCAGVYVCAAGSLCSPDSCQCEGGSSSPGQPDSGRGEPGEKYEEPIPVYNCRCTTPDDCEWYPAQGTFRRQEDGTSVFVSARVTGGAITGPWQGGCPEIADDSGDPVDDGGGQQGSCPPGAKRCP